MPVDEQYVNDRTRYLTSRAAGLDSTGATSVSAALNALIATAQSTDKKPILLEDGVFLIDQEILISGSTAVEIRGNGPGRTTVRIQSDKPEIGAFVLRTDHCVISDLTVEFAGTRSPISGGSYRGYSAFQRRCAVWVESSHCRIERVSARNMCVNTVLRGPVDLDGSQYNYTGFATGNRVYDITGEQCDFILTGNQQYDFVIDGVSGDDGQNRVGVPPHVIYMQNPGVAGSTEGLCRNGNILRLRARNFPYGIPFKFFNMEAVNISDVVTDGMPKNASDSNAILGGVSVGEAKYVQVSNVTVRNMVDVPATEKSYGILFSNAQHCTARNILIDMAPANPCVGICAADASKWIEVDNAMIVTGFATNDGTACRVESGSEAIFRNVTNEVANTYNARPTFVATGEGSKITIVMPIVRPAASNPIRLLTNGAGCFAWLTFAPENITGFVDTMIVNNGTLTQSRTVTTP